MHIITYLKNFIKYIKCGGVTYANISLTSSGKLLKGKRIVITGGSSGIGLAIAKKCVDEGAIVLITGRNEDKLKLAQIKIGYEKCKYLAFDISKITNYSKIIEDMTLIIGHEIDCLVNNAGIYISKPYFEFTADDWEQILDTNLKGLFFLTQKFVERCSKTNNGGNIVMVASDRGLFGDVGPYGISKSGLINYMFGIARDLIIKGIRVNAVAPGMTASNINHIDPSGNIYVDFARGKRVILPEEIAEVVSFLLSDVSKCIVGAVIPCDEGEYLR